MSETTVDTLTTSTTSTTSTAQSEATTRAQEEARREAAEAAAREAMSRLVPHLGLARSGWDPIWAAEVHSNCGNAPDPLLGVLQTSYAAPGVTGRNAVISVVSSYALCPSDRLPTSLDELVPLAGQSPSIDHGTTTVMGREARIVEENGVYWIMWLLDDPGGFARVIVFPGTSPLTVEEAVAIAQGVVELTIEQWQALVAGSGSTSTTVP